MKRNFLKAAAPVAALAVGATSLVAAMGQPSQAAFPNKVFGCNVPGANAQPGGAPNALIASPNNVFNGYPVQMTIGVFRDVTPMGGGAVNTGAGRCFEAMRRLNELAPNAMINSVGVTYQPIRDASGNTTAARVCLVPSAVVGTQSCGSNYLPYSFNNTTDEPVPGVGQSYVLFEVGGRDAERVAANAAELLGSLSVYPNPSFPGGQLIL
ncbi:MAG: hypothetical protein AAF572_05740 [Cyanobacteria bacterium P01_B01_bin.77]